MCFLRGSLRFTADRKVFSKLNFHVPEETVGGIVLCTAGVIEATLSALREKISSKVENARDDPAGCHVRIFYFQNNNKTPKKNTLSVLATKKFKNFFYPHFQLEDKSGLWLL